MTDIWAHARAEAHQTANRMRSFAGAVDERADGLELDVHRTADGHLVCAHDPVLTDAEGRTWSVGDLTYRELREFVDPRTPDDPSPVPLLDEVYDLLRPTGMKLNVEAKNLTRRYPGMAETLSRSVRSSGMTDRVVISTFHHHLLLELRDLDPSLELAALYADGLVEPWTYLNSLGIRQVHPHFSVLAEPGVLEGFARVGVSVRAWTVNDPEVWGALLDAGVDAIITDHPVTARAFAAERITSEPSK